MAALADEKRRVMLAYVVATYPEAVKWSNMDLEYAYWWMKAGLGAPILRNKSLNELRRINAAATPQTAMSTARRTQFSATNTETVNDAAHRYWKAL